VRFNADVTDTSECALFFKADVEAKVIGRLVLPMNIKLTKLTDSHGNPLQATVSLDDGLLPGVSGLGFGIHFADPLVRGPIDIEGEIQFTRLGRSTEVVFESPLSAVGTEQSALGLTVRLDGIDRKSWPYFQVTVTARENDAAAVDILSHVDDEALRLFDSTGAEWKRANGGFDTNKFERKGSVSFRPPGMTPRRGEPSTTPLPSRLVLTLRGNAGRVSYPFASNNIPLPAVLGAP
jgi:hypothetical protein